MAGRSLNRQWRSGKEGRDKAIGSFIAFILGWAWVTLLLCGIYEGGRRAVSYVGWSEEPLVFGLLLTIGFVWIYTRFDIDEKHDRLRDRIDQLEQRLWENGLRPKAE
jgi:hypothetical protein